jgi:hypothetical protein
VALQAALRLSGIELLKAPGPDSNYLDWEFVLDQFLQATKVAYVITLIDPANEPDTWTQPGMLPPPTIATFVPFAGMHLGCGRLFKKPIRTPLLEDVCIGFEN